jgi:SNF2 family DNA or RNA helicase
LTTQVGGAILADEMGLGKTAQAICFLGVLADWENDRWVRLWAEATRSSRRLSSAP